LGSIGYLAHFGVSQVPYFNTSGNTVLSHEGWDGPGWSDDDKNSPALILEATRRFLNTTRCGNDTNKCVVVFSSMLQDMARHCMFFPTENLETWSLRFSAQLSALASRLSDEVNKTSGAQLVLVAGYPSSEKAPFETPWSSPEGLDCHTGPAFQRSSNIETQHVAVELGVPFVHLPKVFADVFLNAPPSTYLRDEIHANLWGLRTHWSALRAVLSSTRELPPPAPATVDTSFAGKEPSKTISSLRLNLLLVGDSRDRLLYHDILLPLCGSGGRPTSWWNPSETEQFSGLGERSANNLYEKKQKGPRIYQVRHGLTCDISSSFASIGFMAHYGVANDQYIDAYHTHGHEGWNGPGWIGSGQNKNQVNSPALIFEATRRFLNTSNCDPTSGSSCVVIFSSMLWDIARHCFSFPELTVGQWGNTFMDQYSAVALKLRDEIRRSHVGAHLILTTGYLTTDQRAPYLLKGGGTCNTPRSFELATHAVARNVSAQLNVPIIDFAVIFSDIFPLATSPYLRDNIHANPDGLRVQWAAIRAALEALVVPLY